MMLYNNDIMMAYTILVYYMHEAASFFLHKQTLVDLVHNN